MATFSRNVTVNWEGPIMEGKGTAKAGNGAFNLPVSFPRRIGDAWHPDRGRRGSLLGGN